VKEIENNEISIGEVKSKNLCEGRKRLLRNL
jgi:hypothetical protein